MDQTSTVDTPAGEAAGAKADIAQFLQFLTEIDRLREQMARDQAEIDRSRTRTRALLAELRAVLAPAGRKAA